MQISINQVHHRYGAHTALDNVSFSAKEGEVIGLLGPNGAGKSTLLRILSGILPPERGSLIYDSTPVTLPAWQNRARIGYLPETPPLYPDMSVTAFLTFCGRLHGLQGAALKSALARTIAQCHLNEVRKRRIGELSTGYQQRVGLAQAILHDPDFLILDEPTVGLDPTQIIEIRQLISRLSPNKIILLSTHILSEVEAICDRVLILNKGRLLFDGPTHPFRSSADSVWEYRLLSPPTPAELSTYCTDQDGQMTAHDRITFKQLADAAAAQQLANLTKRGWQPVEAVCQTPSLEQLFIQLTYRPSQELPSEFQQETPL